MEAWLDNVVVSILTGGRPALLERTLAALNTAAPNLLTSESTFALLNQHCNESLRILHAYDVRHVAASAVHGDVVSVGEATSEIASIVRKMASGVVGGWRVGRHVYWLHLEDDWLCTLDSEAFAQQLNEAKHLLLANPHVKQVRLRSAAESVLTTHMVTRKHIWWQRPSSGLNEPWRYAPDAHMTFNPFLARADEFTLLFPAKGELDFQRRAHRAGFREVMQLVPGAFAHIGGGEESLRVRTGCLQ